MSREHVIEARWSAIPWREPIIVNGGRYACRLCIAMHGLKGSDLDKLSTSKEEVETHIRTAHPPPLVRA